MLTIHHTADKNFDIFKDLNVKPHKTDAHENLNSLVLEIESDLLELSGHAEVEHLTPEEQAEENKKVKAHESEIFNWLIAGHFFCIIKILSCFYLK